MRLRQALSAAFLLCCLAPATGDLSFAASEPELKQAAKQFKRSCGTCHAVEPEASQRQGPNLRFIIGRTAGTQPDFTKYSDAMEAAGENGLVWTRETLDPWITNAGKYIPKTTMSYRQRNAEKRALIITYLESLQTPDATEQ